MADVSDVLNCLMSYADMEPTDGDEAISCCERALALIKSRLRSGIKEDNPLIAPTAAAMAHYFFFLSRLTQTDKYEAFTAGDMTIRRSLPKELSFERTVLDEALAAASSILTDTGFLFYGS